MDAIRAEALTKTYRGLLRKAGEPALCGLDLAVAPGTAFGLIGPNGAGKTTFIKILLGVVRPTSGKVEVLGGHPEDLAVRARIGYLPERLHLPEAWRPPEFLASVARLKGKRPVRAEISRLLERVGLAQAAGRKIAGFSKGMRQRLGLAAAVLGGPDLLVLDEPTDGIDPLGRVEVRKILTEELSRGATLFLNSHLLAETERVCERVGILASGRLAREGRLVDLCRTGERWILEFAPGHDAAALAGIGLSPLAGGRWGCEAETAQALNLVLDRARASGALLVRLERDERDLEEVLADAVRVAA